MVSAALTLNDLNDDVLYEICSFVYALTYDYGDSLGSVSLKKLSLVNKHFREVSAPILFRNVHVIGLTVLKSDWVAAGTAIATLQNSLMRHIRNFKFSIYASGCPTYEQLVKVLARMPQLGKLVLCVPLPHVSALESAFEAADILLPSVNTLVVNTLCIFVVNKCPNLEAASIHTPYHWNHRQSHVVSPFVIQKYKANLVKALSLAKRLRRFEAEGPWRVDDLHALATVAPKLRWLGMRGTLHGYEADSTLEKLTALSRFEILERLDIADISELGLEFDLPWCGNDMGFTLQEAKEARYEMVARATFSSCASLKEVWVGERSKAQSVRGEDGNIDKIIWSRGEQITGSIAK